MRLVLAVVAVVLLMAGYIGSQISYLNGEAAAWAARMDQPAIRALSALFLVAALVLTFIPDKENAPQ